MTRIALLLALATLTTGCSNVIRSGLLSSNTIFLPPSAHRTVFVHTHNVSENQRVTLDGVVNRLAGKGYQVVAHPDQAHYWLQTSVVYCHKAGPGVTAERIVQAGFGAGIGSGGMTLSAGDPLMGGNREGTPDVAAMMAMVQASMRQAPPAEDGVLYLCVADVQVTERPSAVHRVRMVASVRQKKLRVEEATPIVQDKLTIGIAGLL